MSEFGKDINVPSRKGVFIPDITVEMFRNASLEGVEELMANGEMEDISLTSAQLDLSSYSDKLWRNAYERGRKDAVEEIIHCRECKYHIDGFFCQVANHHTLDKDCCASVFGAERRKE